jgi:uncharacterized oxidoreductase
MPTFKVDYLERITAQIFAAAAVPEDEACLMGHELVYANLIGVDSHGVIRIPQYIEAIEQGEIKPGGPTTVVKESTTTALIEGGDNFGQVVAFRALDIAVNKARSHNVSCVLAHRCNHVGRLGAYPQKAAKQDMICLATATWPVHGHSVAPFGGRKARLATNPIAYGVPTKAQPLLSDFATSVMAEGRIRVVRNQGGRLPDQVVLNHEGQATNDPNQFYGPPRGAILPFGGPVGYKGYALSLLVEILGGTMAGSLVDDETRLGNGLCLIVINPSAFTELNHFKEMMEGLSSFMKATPPAEGFDEVFLPGELDFQRVARRQEDGIPLDDTTWDHIKQAGERFGITLSV